MAGHDFSLLTCAAPGDDKVMIATRRADVADLNDRARALLDAAGRFGNHELGIDRRIRVAGREFAVGDQVLATGRNHWDGDIGTVRVREGTIRDDAVALEQIDHS
jgi:hypothetical protein